MHLLNISLNHISEKVTRINSQRGRRGRGRDRIVVGFTTTYPFTAYHHQNCEFEFRSWRGVLHATLCDKV